MAKYNALNSDRAFRAAKQTWMKCIASLRKDLDSNEPNFQSLQGKCAELYTPTGQGYQSYLLTAQTEDNTDCCR